MKKTHDKKGCLHALSFQLSDLLMLLRYWDCRLVRMEVPLCACICLAQKWDTTWWNEVSLLLIILSGMCNTFGRWCTCSSLCLAVGAQVVSVPTSLSGKQSSRPVRNQSDSMPWNQSARSALVGFSKEEGTWLASVACHGLLGTCDDSHR